MHYRQYRVLRISFWIKLAFIFVELGLAVAFGTLNDKGMYNASAIVEWCIAFIFTFYVWSFAIDFIPAVHHKNFDSKETVLQMAEQGQNRNEATVIGNGHANGAANGHATNF
jgi:hypothetical protein